MPACCVFANTCRSGMVSRHLFFRYLSPVPGGKLSTVVDSGRSPRHEIRRGCRVQGEACSATNKNSSSIVEEEFLSDRKCHQAFWAGRFMRHIVQVRNVANRIQTK